VALRASTMAAIRARCLTPRRCRPIVRRLTFRSASFIAASHLPPFWQQSRMSVRYEWVAAVKWLGAEPPTGTALWSKRGARLWLPHALESFQRFPRAKEEQLEGRIWRGTPLQTCTGPLIASLRGWRWSPSLIDLCALAHWELTRRWAKLSPVCWCLTLSTRRSMWLNCSSEHAGQPSPCPQ
jgi:hypothetical protein